MKTMKAAVLVAPHEFELREVPRPQIGPDDVLIRVTRIGICGTDLHMFHGHYAADDLPIIPGHEFCGTIEEVGANQRHLTPGQMVVADINIGCGHCYWCRRNEVLSCPEMAQLGITRDGAFAEFVALPGRLVIPAPEGIAPEILALTEPVACVVRAARKARAGLGQSVLVLGAGPVGNLHVQMMRLVGAAPIGAHILSGAVLDTSGLDKLIPDWKDKGAPVTTEVTSDNFYVLGEQGQMRVPNWPMPPLMSNHGKYIVSMGNVCRWLAEQAEALEVEIFPGMACSQLVYEGSRVVGVVAGEMGLEADGTPGPGYEPGMELRGKYVLIAEGVRGSLAKELIGKYDLSAGHEPQKFGLGMKEIWEIDPAKAKPGTVTHTMGWPLGKNAGGGSFIYHLGGNQVLVGFVVHLNYKNPYLYPYMEFQRFKHHPLVAELLEGGKRVAYGARAISEGGWQSIPKLTVPGALLLGCSAGLVNVPRIKGNHNAMLSGIAAAEAAAAAIAAGREGDELPDYETEVRKGAIGKDLRPVRNVKPVWSKLGLWPSLALGGLDMWVANLTGWNPLGTWKHGKTDAAATGKAADFKPIDYPRPDGKLSFDRLTNVAFSFTNHEESQPCHLRLKDASTPIKVNLPLYAEPAQRYCPAGVYEVLESEDGPKFQINFQNCVHCKTCDIKDPSQNINWTTPQGGDGPNYPNM